MNITVSGYWNVNPTPLYSMTLVDKVERALALARDLSMNDQQVKELITIILGTAAINITTPIVPWTPNDVSNWPPYPKDTFIVSNDAQTKK